MEEGYICPQNDRNETMRRGKRKKRKKQTTRK
jgi:hypothetical protein